MVAKAAAAAVALAALVMSAPAPAFAFDALVSWTRNPDAAGYKVYVRHDTRAFVKAVGPEGVSAELVAQALPTSVAARPGADDDLLDTRDVRDSATAESVHFLVTDLPLGPRIFFTVTAQDAESGEESDHSNELSIDYSSVAKVIDSDGDGLKDAQEDTNLNGVRDEGETDPLSADTDGDGLADGDERASGLDPLNADSDGDGETDAVDTCFDLDRDGFGAAGIPSSTCPVDNCPDDANPDQRDTDADGLGEACDPCTNVGGVQDFKIKPKLVFRNLKNADAFDDSMVIKGEFALGIGTNYADLDPATEGARVGVNAFDRAEIVGVDVPEGTFPGRKGSRGWKVRRDGAWKYLDKTSEYIGGIKKIVIKDKSRRAPRLVRVIVKGKRASYPVLPDDPPVNASVVLGDSVAGLEGRCGETAFNSSDCRFNGSGGALLCGED